MVENSRTYSKKFLPPVGMLYTVIASSPGKEVHDPWAFYLHAALLRQAFAHAENSPLLPPVGVWAVSQSQCG
ncbi:Unknown protein [Striga hermonthica]|uniref:Uncharacterized protein n=1 Tax=Striga hermonthica TaxID=68872 RepID=A0A9N7MQ77_STRHE|nr:Unknown protein [Striga hermonthica]